MPSTASNPEHAGGRALYIAPKSHAPLLQRLRPVLLVLAAMPVFVALLGRRDIGTSHEARVAQTARQMADAGWPWNARALSVPVSGLIEGAEGKRLAALPREGNTRVNEIRARLQRDYVVGTRIVDTVVYIRKPAMTDRLRSSTCPAGQREVLFCPRFSSDTLGYYE